MLYTDLYMMDTFLDKNISILTNRVIIEYDLKSANTNLCREYKLLPVEKIESIEAMPKNKRVREIGLLMRKNQTFKEGLKNAFIDIRRRFFDSNDIKEEDILSIKKDAIFCLRDMSVTQFGDCIFVEKNKYSSYLYINKFEIYYSSGFNNYVDIKGIDDYVVHKHDGYMIKFLMTLFKHLETSNKQKQLVYMRKFIDRYKNLELDTGYYREFNQESIIRMIDDNETYDDITFIPYENPNNHINITYNYFSIIIPILELLV